MGTPVYLNGRFLEQRLTGVQRFAQEMTMAIVDLAVRGDFPDIKVLVPPPRSVSNRPSCYGLDVRSVGRMHGHLWEQIALPIAARDGILLNLGNVGPLLAGARQVVVIHDAGIFDVPESYGWRFRTWYRALQHGLVRAHARIVTVSQFSRERIAARLAIDPTEIAVTYEGAEHVLRAAPDPATLARHGLRLRRFVLAVGVGVGHKNLDSLDRLAVELGTRGMVLAVVGSGGHVAFAQGDGQSDPVGRILGRVTDAELRTLYDSAACLVFPSRYEGFGLPPIEAMACGCPVIAAGGGAVEEVCGPAAIYFDPANPEAIADLCRCVLDDPELTCDLAVRGRVRAARFTWEGAARVLADVIAEVRDGDRPRHSGERTRDHAPFFS